MGASRPLIAIVGRPNVGKSRLFNRLTGRRHAIVENTPGVTRDRHYGDGSWDGKVYSIVDTGGFDPDSEDVLLKQMREQAQLALDEADLILFVMDSRTGLLPTDIEIARMLRVSDKLVFPVVNKVDGPRHDDLVSDFYQLGFEVLYPVSAEHGHQIDELMEAVCEYLPTRKQVEESNDADDLLKIAVVGKPNVGKSSLINKILRAERLLTSDIPGTTRDSIDTRATINGRQYLFIDTAGIRRKRSISLLVEKFSVVKAFKSIDRADVVLYMIDATEGLSEQDKRLIGIASDKGKPHIILVNKWDLVDKDQGTAGEWVKELRSELNYLAYGPVLFISALTGQRVHKIFDTVDGVVANWSTRISTGPLNRWFLTLVSRQPPPTQKGKRPKFFYASQVAIRPPTFLVSVNRPDAIKTAYKRFILNRLRADFEFSATPLKIFYRPRGSEEEKPHD